MTTSLMMAPLTTRKQKYILPGDIFAFERDGLLSRLLRGSEVTIIGDGFSDRTVKALSSGATYFIFLRDLEDGVDYSASLYS